MAEEVGAEGSGQNQMGPAECIRAGPPAGVALPKSIAEPYPAQTSIHLLSDDFPRLIGRGPGDGRHRDRAEPGEMSIHPCGVGQSHPNPSLQHQASHVPTDGERFRATPNLLLKVGETQVGVVICKKAPRTNQDIAVQGYRAHSLPR